MKFGLLQILYVNPFTKLYELSRTLGATEEEEDVMFMRLFSHSFIDKSKEWYLDQPTHGITSWNTREEKFINRFFPYNKFMKVKNNIDVFPKEHHRLYVKPESDTNPCYEYV